MKLNGQQLSQEITHHFSLSRPSGTILEFTLTPLRLGFHQRLRQRSIILPAPPTKIARDSSGKPLKDNSGKALIVPDATNAQHQNEVELYHQRVAVLSLVESLRTDPNIEFETPVPTSSDWTTYADDIFTELESAGFSAGDLIHLCQEVCRISNLLDQHLTSAQANFSTLHETNST